jgi:hypothetical protein
VYDVSCAPCQSGADAVQTFRTPRWFDTQATRRPSREATSSEANGADRTCFSVNGPVATKSGTAAANAARAPISGNDKPPGGGFDRIEASALLSYLCICYSILLSAALALAATPADTEKRIDPLIAKMTLDEKIGQMSQQSMGKVTDQLKDKIRKGRWGSFLNGGTPEDRVELQRIALKESRLGVPLIFGRDVIHGYRTVFPIPLGQAAS